MSYWRAHDAVTFLIDLGVYRPALRAFLTDDERAQVRRFRPAISRQRFVVSRAVLKHILSEILSEETIADIVLTRNADGRISVEDGPHVYISLSYHGPSIAITVGKWKLGSDIEGVRPVRDGKITASPAYRTYAHPEGTVEGQQVIHLWTLVESCAKLFDTNPYPLLDRCSPFGDADFVSYCIDRQMIFSLASTRGLLTDVLVWLDILGIGKEYRIPSDPPSRIQGTMGV